VRPLHSTPMSSSFEDIAIVDLDLSKTTWSRVHSAMRTLYLRLSHDPEVGWVKFFHEERESRVVLKRHGLWIEDGYIVFDCLLEDVDQHHLPDFRLSVQYANQKYRELLAERRDEGMQMRNDARVEQLELAMLRARIRSGSPAPVASSAAALPPVLKPVAKITVPSASPAPAEHNTAKAERKPPLATPQRSVPPRPSLPPRQQTSRIDIAAQPAVPTAVVPVNGAHAPPEVATNMAAAVSKDDASTDIASTDVAPKTSPAAAAAPPASTTPASTTPPSTSVRDDAADFDAKREEWRARFRAAYASSRPKEPSRGND
jgi:hypothetical protein